MVNGLSSWLQAFVRSPLDAPVVVSRRDDNVDKRMYKVEYKVGAVVDKAFEKLINGSQYKLSLLQHFTGYGSTLNGVLSHASGWIDATRIFTEINWFFNGEAINAKNNTEWFCTWAVHGCLFALGALSTACALDQFGIYDFASISAKIGGITSYGGLGVIGAVPTIHVIIAILMVALVVNTLREKGWDGVWNDSEARWKMGGRCAEIALRAVTLTFASAPLLIPVLGIISQDIGLFFAVKDTKKAIVVQDEFYEDNKRISHNLLLGSEYDKEIGKQYALGTKGPGVNQRHVYNTANHPVLIVRKVTNKTSLASKYTGTIAKLMARILQVAADIFSSIKGLDLFTKFSVAICAVVAPQYKELIQTMKNFRLASGARNILSMFDGPLIECQQKDQVSCPWKNTARKVTGYGTFGFLVIGYSADLAKFVTKSNILNLASFANDLGKVKVFGFVGTVSFNTIKASSMFFVLIFEIAKFVIDIDMEKLKNNRQYQIDLAINISLSAAKIGVIFISGGFMFYVGWGAASAASNLIQSIVFAADLAYWIRKESINKNETEHWGLPYKEETEIKKLGMVAKRWYTDENGETCQENDMPKPTKKEQEKIEIKMNGGSENLTVNEGTAGD